MSIHLSQQEWGLVLVALAFAAYFTGKFKTLASVGLFIGILWIGLNGWIISHLAALFGLIAAKAGPVVAGIIGVSVAGVFAAAVAVLFYFVLHDWAPKNPAKRRTFWLSGVAAIITLVFLTPVVSLVQGV
jgi:MFS family permease